VPDGAIGEAELPSDVFDGQALLSQPQQVRLSRSEGLPSIGRGRSMQGPDRLA
jgi:hypothetical protein